MKTKTMTVLLIAGLLAVVFASSAMGAIMCKTKTTTMTYPILTQSSLVYKQGIVWCYDGSKIKLFNYVVAGYVNGNIYWSYKGVKASGTSGGIGSSYVSVGTTGYFYNQRPSPSLGNLYPHITQRVTATGGFSATTYW